MTANLLPLVALLVTPAALAGQSRPASDFNGTWDLSCASATLTLHLDLSGGTAAGSGSWGDHVVTPLDCDGIDEQEQASLHADLYATCTSAGLPAAGCDEVAGDLTATVASFNDDAVAFLPTSVTMKVGSHGWFWSGLLMNHHRLEIHDRLHMCQCIFQLCSVLCRNKNTAGVFSNTSKAGMGIVFKIKADDMGGKLYTLLRQLLSQRARVGLTGFQPIRDKHHSGRSVAIG